MANTARNGSTSVVLTSPFAWGGVGLTLESMGHENVVLIDQQGNWALNTSGVYEIVESESDFPWGKSFSYQGITYTPPFNINVDAGARRLWITDSTGKQTPMIFGEAGAFDGWWQNEGNAYALQVLREVYGDKLQFWTKGVGGYEWSDMGTPYESGTTEQGVDQNGYMTYTQYKTLMTGGNMSLFNGYNPAVSQRLTHDTSGNFVWVDN